MTPGNMKFSLSIQLRWARVLQRAGALLAFLIPAAVACAQAPQWMVNAANYQYSMNIVAFLNVNHQTLTSGEDKVAAFVDGAVRGVASPIYLAATDRYLAYLPVYANKEGEEIRFRIYNSAAGSIVDVDTTLTFRIDGQVGNAFQAFSLASPPLRKEARFLNFFFTGVDSVSTAIDSTKISIIVEYDVDVGALTPEFTVSEGAKVYIGSAPQESGATVMDFRAPIAYTVLSEDESAMNTFEVTVANRQTTDNGFTATNVITPNNDGMNDFWIVTDVFKYKDCEFTILDANGRVLYKSAGYHNDWNGYYRGDRLTRGKYYYVVRDPMTNTTFDGDILVVY